MARLSLLSLCTLGLNFAQTSSSRLSPSYRRPSLAVRSFPNTTTIDPLQYVDPLIGAANGGITDHLIPLGTFVDF